MTTTKSRRKSSGTVSKPYLLALGQLAYDWSALHETLELVFGAVVANGDGRISSAIWQSQNNDRSQREMLRFATEARTWPKGSRAKDDISYLLSEVQSLQDKRNDAIHSPYMMVHGLKDATGIPQWTFEPWSFHGNTRATKLKDKNLLEELAWYSEWARTMLRFAWSLHSAVMTIGAVPWPERPKRPLLGQSQTRKRSRPKKHTK
jgi:hypothetical protein